MTTETRSHNWPLITIVVLLGFLAVAIFSALESKRKLAEKDATDSLLFKDSRNTVIRYIQRTDDAERREKTAILMMADKDAAHAREKAAWKVERSGYIRKIAEINTSAKTTEWLDSVQLALLGPPKTDSTHTIPLEYSRMLTGDALRLPIEQRLATRTQEKLDSAESHYGRMQGDYELRIHDLKQDKAADAETIHTLMDNTGKMQGKLNDQAKRFKKIRRRERLVETLIVVGVVILAL